MGSFSHRRLMQVYVYYLCSGIRSLNPACSSCGSSVLETTTPFFLFFFPPDLFNPFAALRASFNDVTDKVRVIY